MGQHDIVVLHDVPPPHHPPWKSVILSELQLFQSFLTEVAQNDSEWPISPDLQLFQSFPTKVAQNDSKWPISPDSQLFQSFPNKVAQNDLEWPILPNLQFFQSFPTKAAQNDSEWPILHGQNKINLIQGNFYERLPFYMDSCATKPYGFLVLLLCDSFTVRSNTH